MVSLPPEIIVAVICALTSDTKPGAYTLSPEVKATLHSLGLVSYACHQWASKMLYSRITVAHHQISQLLAALSLDTSHAHDLAKRSKLSASL